MNTLADFALMSTDVLKKGIALTIIYEEPLLAKLPFIDIVGNSYQYNLESTEAGADFYNVGDVWRESTPAWNQRSVGLTILGGDADVDEFLKATRSNVQDVEAEILSLKSKAISYKFSKTLITGGTTTLKDPLEFKGMLQLIAEIEAVGKTDLDGVNNIGVFPFNAASGTIDLPGLDAFIDSFKGGKPQYLMTSKRMRRKITSLCRVTGAVTSYTTLDSRLGLQVEAYNGIPILVNDWIADNYPDNVSSVLDIAAYNPATTRASGDDNTPIFAFRLGGDGVCGLQNGGLTTVPVGQLETKDAHRTRIKWYCGLALFNIHAAKVMTGATDGT